MNEFRQVQACITELHLLRKIPVVTSDTLEVFLYCGGDSVYKHKSIVKAQSDEHEEEEERPKLGYARGCALQGHWVCNVCQPGTFPITSRLIMTHHQVKFCS